MSVLGLSLFKEEITQFILYNLRFGVYVVEDTTNKLQLNLTIQ
jgi:hypothetical protein